MLIKRIKKDLTFSLNCAYIEIACEVKVLFLYSDHNNAVLILGEDLPQKHFLTCTPGLGRFFCFKNHQEGGEGEMVESLFNWTSGINNEIADNAEFSKFVITCLERHGRRDWGDISEQDRQSMRSGWVWLMTKFKIGEKLAGGIRLGLTKSERG